MKSCWTTVPNIRPGYLGKKRDDYIKKMNKEHGKGKWRFAWETFGLGLHHYLPIERALLIYEDAYFFFICGKKVVTDDGVLLALDSGGQTSMAMEIAQYAECYDNDVTNVKSGIDYSKQENNSNHYQDIAIRRVLARCGLRFLGRKQELLHVRHDSKQELGRKLSPGRVPFHLPVLVKQPELNGWWNPRTTEAWYQSSKVIQVKNGEAK
jgi:hypothetical protein